MAMKLFTRQGDRGDTSLVGGLRVRKDGPQVEAYGDLDELSSHLGYVQTELTPADRTVAAMLERIQHELFILSSELATPSGKSPPHRIEARHVQRLEAEIEVLSEGLEGRKAFVLPRGTRAGAHLHVARTVARRAERSVVRYGRVETVRPEVQEYVNRLSSLLFALALSVNHAAGFAELAPDYTQ